MFFSFFSVFVLVPTCAFLLSLAHNCFVLHTDALAPACVSLYHWSCSNLCMVVLTCVCPRLLPPTSGCSHLHMVIPCLSLFPARHCSPLIAPRPLLFPTCCCSLPIVATLFLLLAFLKVPMAPLLLLLLFAHCYSPLVFPHMVLPPPSLPFASSFWSHKQKPTSNKVSFFFLISLFIWSFLKFFVLASVFQFF